MRYNATVQSVASGDDLTLLVDLGVDGLFKKVRARLLGVDAPNAFHVTPESEAAKVRDFVRDVTSGVTVQIDVHQEKSRSGWLVTLYVPNGTGMESLNRVLAERGFVFRRKGPNDDQ